MKVLLDTCVWGGVVHELQAAGHDVIWVADWPHDPGDEEILSRAEAEGRVLITLDKDFGELAVVHELPHYGIVRLANLSIRDQAATCLEILSRYGDELHRGGVVTAERGRLRIRSMPSDSASDDVNGPVTE